MNFTRLGYVVERAEVGEHREAILAVTIPERPGAFLAFCAALGDRGVTEFNYRLASRAEAHIFVGLVVTGRDEARAIARELTARGYACVDLGENDLAKTHIRHMVGGRTPAVRDEVRVAVRVPRAAGRAAAVPDAARLALEHLAVPLPQPRRRVRPRALRPRGAARRARRAARAARRARLRVGRRDRQPGGSLLPGVTPRSVGQQCQELAAQVRVFRNAPRMMLLVILESMSFTPRHCMQ